MSMFVLLILILMLAAPGAQAHVDVAEVESWWSLDPWVWLPLLICLLLYLRGLGRLLQKGAKVALWRVSCFFAALLTLFIALIWPFEVLGAVSFAAHMGQHMLLMSIAAPLLAVAAPMPVLLLGLNRRSRKRLLRGWRGCGGSRLWRVLTQPPVAFCLHAFAIWLWHAPAAFEFALAFEFAHFLEHVSFLGTAVLFWWSLLLLGRRRAHGHGVAVLWVLATLMHTGLLGAIITFAPVPLYPYYLEQQTLGLTALEDQQLAGLIMWVPGGALYLVAGLLFCARWLSCSGAGAAMGARRQARVRRL